jgi:hypothetical protein
VHQSCAGLELFPAVPVVSTTVSVAGPAVVCSPGAGAGAAAGACIRVAQDLGCCPASGRAVPQGHALELGVLQAYSAGPVVSLATTGVTVLLGRPVRHCGLLCLFMFSAWPVVSTTGVLLGRPVVHCAC